MKQYKTRKDQLLAFVTELYEDIPDLPKSARARIRRFGRDCMMCGAAEERYNALKFVPWEQEREQILKDSVLKVLGFEK